MENRLADGLVIFFIVPKYRKVIELYGILICLFILI